MIRRSLASSLLGGLVVVIGCGGGSGRSGFEDQLNGDGQPPTQNTTGAPDDQGSFGKGTATPGVVIDPKNATVIIDSATNPATPGSVTYKMIANGKDVTAGTTFTLKDGSLGTFKGAAFTSIPALPAGTLGKSTQVVGQSADGQGLGTLTVVQLRKTGAQRDFFFVVPYGGDPTPKSDILTFSTNIKQADVAFVMDTTGSMTGAIDNLKTALSGTLLAQLQAAIPNVGLAVIDVRDFDSGDSWAVNVRQRITTTLSLAQTAVNAMSAYGGGDEPEAQLFGMYHALTGAASTTGSPALAAHTPAAGTWGGVDFRSGSVAVVVDISDAHWHDPSGGQGIAQLKSAFASTKAKFVNILENHYIASEPDLENQPNDLSDATGSNVVASAFGTVAGCAAGQCCTGVSGAGRAPAGPAGSCRLNFLANNGNGVSAGIVKAIQAIAVGSVFDVTAKASNDPKNAGGVDATKFIKALRAMDEGNAAAGCPAHVATDTNGDGIKDTFTALQAGTPVCFEIIANTNSFVPPLLDPQFFNAFVDVIAVQGNLPLDHRAVIFMVPPKDPGVQ
jgi:hypothetical protein